VRRENNVSNDETASARSSALDHSRGFRLRIDLELATLRSNTKRTCMRLFTFIGVMPVHGPT
jgi:hypothetical protein